MMRFLCMALALPLTVLADPAPSTTHVSLLTYNVRGLPPVLTDDDPLNRISEIQTHLQARRYDIVLLQELFAFAPLIQAAERPPAKFFSGPAARITDNNILGVALAKIPCWISAYCQMPADSGLASLVYAPGIQST